jgi:hypothetical protein
MSDFIDATGGATDQRRKKEDQDQTKARNAPQARVSEI